MLWLRPAGHPDVGRGGAGGVPDGDVGAVDGLALGAVDGGGVGELDVPVAYSAGSGRVAPVGRAGRRLPSLADAGDGPGLPVGDPEVGVVAAGGDPVADPDPLAAQRSPRRPAWLVAGRRVGAALVADRGVEVGDLLAGVGDDQVAGCARPAASAAVRSTSLGWIDDLPAAMQRVEDLGGVARRCASAG